MLVQLTGLVSEVTKLRDASEELYVVLDHFYPNREEFFDVLQEDEERAPESLSCVTCEAEQSSLAAVVTAGWSQLQAEGEEFLGTCPDRLAKQISTIQGETREQLLYCCNQPDLRWNGGPDHPGVACGNCDYVVADCGSLVTYTPEEAAEVAEKAKQRSLFD